MEAFVTIAPLCILGAGFVYFGLRSVSAMRKHNRVRRVPERADIGYCKAESEEEWRNGSCPEEKEGDAGRSPGGHGLVLDQPGVCWGDERKGLRRIRLNFLSRTKRRRGKDVPGSLGEGKGSVAARKKDCRRGSDGRGDARRDSGAEEDDPDEARVLVEDACGVKGKCQGWQVAESRGNGRAEGRGVIGDEVERGVQLREGSVQVIDAVREGMRDWIGVKEGVRDQETRPDKEGQETSSSGQGIGGGVGRDEQVRQEVVGEEIEARQGDENLTAWPCRPNFSGSLYVAGWDGGEGWRREAKAKGLILSENDMDAVRFLRDFEKETLRISVGQETDPWRMAMILERCLRGARQKICHDLLREAGRTGRSAREPGEVYKEMVAEVLAYHEDEDVVRKRVLKGVREFRKGDETAVQFGRRFGQLCEEVRKAGLGEVRTKLVWVYLQKVGRRAGQEITADRRCYGGGAESRSIESWEEAHEVCLELEGDLGECGRRECSGDLGFRDERRKACGGRGKDRDAMGCRREGECEERGDEGDLKEGAPGRRARICAGKLGRKALGRRASRSPGLFKGTR